MQTAFMNLRDIVLTHNGQNILIRAGILLSHYIGISPYHFYTINYENILPNVSDSMSYKIGVIDDFANSFLPEDGFLDAIERMKKSLPQYHRLCNQKRRDKQVLVQIKQMEIIINNIYNIVLGVYIRGMKETGLPALNELKYNEYFQVLDLTDDGEPSLDPYVNHTPTEVMKLQFIPLREEKKLFGFDGIYESKLPTWSSVASTEANNKNNTWLEWSFDVTGIDELSPNELQSLREMITPERTAFNDVMNEWIEATQIDSLSFNDIDFYKNRVAATVEALNEKINGHILMQPFAWKENRTMMRLGAMPVQAIWKMYHQLKFIDEATLATLMNDIEQLPFAGRWPVMTTAMYHRSTREEYIFSNEAPLKKKKTISLD